MSFDLNYRFGKEYMKLLILMQILFFSYQSFGFEKPIGYETRRMGQVTVKIPVFPVSQATGDRIVRAANQPGMMKKPLSLSPGPISENLSLRSMMSPVRNQGQRGTCTVFAALGIIEFF